MSSVDRSGVSTADGLVRSGEEVPSSASSSVTEPDLTSLPPLPGALKFAGDKRGVVGQLFGPTTYGAMVVAVSAEYDAVADRTRVKCALAPSSAQTISPESTLSARTTAPTTT